MSRHRNPISTLYVRNLSERARHDDIRRLFQKYGKVIDITIPLDYYSRSSKGYCFIQGQLSEYTRDAEEALYKLDKQTLFGRELEVEFARGDRKTANDMRSRDREKRYQRSDRDRGDRRHDSRRSHSRSRSRSRGKSDRHKKRRHDSRSKSRSSRSHSKEKTIRNNNKSLSREVGSRSRSRSPVEKGNVNSNGISNNGKRSHSESSPRSSPPQSPRRHRKSGDESRSRSGSPIDD